MVLSESCPKKECLVKQEDVNCVVIKEEPQTDIETYLVIEEPNLKPEPEFDAHENGETGSFEFIDVNRPTTCDSQQLY